MLELKDAVSLFEDSNIMCEKSMACLRKSAGHSRPESNYSCIASYTQQVALLSLLGMRLHPQEGDLKQVAKYRWCHGRYAEEMGWQSGRQFAIIMLEAFTASKTLSEESKSACSSASGVFPTQHHIIRNRNTGRRLYQSQHLSLSYI